MPKMVYPQLATLVDKPPRGDAWLHEIKFDGYRLIAIKTSQKTLLYTRAGNDWTHYFPAIAHAIDALPVAQAIFDGEVVMLDKHQISNFQLLQNSIKAAVKQHFNYYVFDLIYYDHYDLSSLPLIERKKILQQIIPSVNGPILRYSDHVIGSGAQVFKNSCKLGLEGIVSKAIESTYQQKRSKAWLKTKCTERQEFIIAGFTPPQKSRQFFGSLLLGSYDKHKKLHYHGNVGTGFTQSSLQELYKKLKKIITPNMPFAKKPPNSKNTTWVLPKLVAEVEFSQWTQDNILRHPSFKGLREDKAPSKIHVEKPTLIGESSDEKTKKRK